MDGIIIVHKEEGYTSHDVVARLRHILGMKRIGHTGTLDPMATGVLPVAVSRATRLVELLADKDKSYEALMHLGVVTDTQDRTGTVLSESPVLADERQIEEACLSFIGERDQIPPMYSALKIEGKRLYELAREGKTVSRKPRRVCFYDIKVKEISLPFVRLEVTCSKGTYIRTLLHDIGQVLGCGAMMEALVRTRVGEFSLSQAHTLDEIQSCVSAGCDKELYIGIEEVLKAYPRMVCPESQDKRLLNGNPLVLEGGQEAERVRMCTSDGVFRGLYEYNGSQGLFRPVKIF
ncbi:MAG: tRNA pseudouridine(55) synthase TruB [Blautia sp.]|nr:tRNA pseudouridine(55) synthase TruB [Blautia sp.]